MPAPAHGRARALQQIVLWLALGGWIGALLLCVGVVIRAAFELVPQPVAAAHVVGRVLGSLQLTGMALGVGLAALGGTLRRGRLVVALPLLLAILCAVNQFGVMPAVAAIDLTDPAAGPGAGARFALLHRASVSLFTATLVGAIALAALHAVRELGEAPHGSGQGLEKT